MKELYDLAAHHPVVSCPLTHPDRASSYAMQIGVREGWHARLAPKATIISQTSSARGARRVVCLCA